MKVCLICGVKYGGDEWVCPKCTNRPKMFGSIVAHDYEQSRLELGFPQEAFAEIYEAERSHFWFRARTKLIISQVNKFFANACKFLEVGCGTGLFLQNLSSECPKMQLTGSDISLVGLSYASLQFKKAKLVQFNVIKMPYYEEFDLIGVFDVIEHICDDLQALKEINKALVNGGGLIVTVPQHPFLWGESDRINQHKRRYIRSNLKVLLKEAGFEIIRTTSFVSLLFPIMAVKRLLIKSNNQKEVLYDELKLNNFVNVVFEIVMLIELFFIRFGVNFPWGGSLIVVARKK